MGCQNRPFYFGLLYTISQTLNRKQFAEIHEKTKAKINKQKKIFFCPKCLKTQTLVYLHTKAGLTLANFTAAWWVASLFTGKGVSRQPVGILFRAAWHLASTAHWGPQGWPESQPTMTAALQLLQISNAHFYIFSHLQHIYSPNIYPVFTGETLDLNSDSLTSYTVQLVLTGLIIHCLTFHY